MRVLFSPRLQSSYSALKHCLRQFDGVRPSSKQAWIATARALSSGASRVRTRPNNKTGGRNHEDDQMQKIERENELWRLRNLKGDVALPPALPVECRRGKGQHLLKNSHIADVIVEKAGVRSTDTVLEIGPGTGNLTLKLLQVAKKVIAVEVDPRMIEELQRRVQLTDLAHKLEVIKGDIMRMEFPEFDLCVANIPYKISSPLTFKLLSCTSKYRAAVMMLQREFAKRLMATAGDPLFSRLSANTQLLASVSILMEVSKANFSPPPKVDSTVVCISPHLSPPPVDLQEWNNFIRVCFSRKNKTLGAIFRQKHILSLLAGHSSQGFSGPDEEDSEDIECKDLAVDYSQQEDQEVEPRNTELCSQVDLGELKETALDVLGCLGFAERRSVKLTQPEFLKLLASFNEAGINFGNARTARPA
ncbi:hypothetical protein GOP47_0018335 [Adiantum capillus-veneris]|uniref:rRNA adenine N(6)-methyltransferase n=1 Tax=Adiantum capillus-veneris TaxID=13818 RepID=A0A9D4ZBH6_ADICA|nr:hypothetical protein GOP47_0018335 [Adiantum capillus-veneris]